MLDRKKKEKIIAQFKTHASDTGSSQVQIAILTEEIKELTNHLKSHKKAFSSRRGLLKKVAERRRLLTYLKREDEKGFGRLVKELKLKTAVLQAEEPAKKEDPAESSDEGSGEASSETPSEE